MNGNDVKAYSLALDGNTKLPNAQGHFKVREFRCQDGTDTIFVSEGLADILEAIRLHFSAPVVITSGYRTEPHNKKVGGSPRSQHKYGVAADIQVRGVAPSAVADYARSLMPNRGGVGRYSTFTHVDVRKRRSDWRG